MEAAARAVLHVKWTDEEKSSLPRHGEESWIGLYQEFLKLFRLPLQFDKLVGKFIRYVEGTDKTTVRTNMTSTTAICSNIMRDGKHYVSFLIEKKNSTSTEPSFVISCGIMRPTTKENKGYYNFEALPSCWSRPFSVFSEEI